MSTATQETETVAPLRIGAKAQRLISESDRPQDQIDAAVAAAEAMARERGDRILRDYYLYLALGIDMPERIAKEWAYFQANGKEMAGTGSAKPKAEKEDSGNA